MMLIISYLLIYQLLTPENEQVVWSAGSGLLS